MGSASRSRPPPESVTGSELDSPPPARPVAWRIAGGIAAAVLSIILATGLWWLASVRHRSASESRACRDVVEGTWVRGGGECLHMQVYRSATASVHPDLVVVLHGDAPFANPSYQYAAARRISTEVGNAIAVGLLRPGYTDAEGHRSSGVRGRAIGDNYTPTVVDAVADAIGQLAQAYLVARVFLVGHSGGAAIIGDVIARHPGLVDGAVLVSCPCDVPAWRRHMDSVQHTPVWRVAVQSLSPFDLAAQVDPRTTVDVVLGSADPVVPPTLGRLYAQRLAAHGVRVHVTEIPGAGHDILLDPRVIHAITDALQPSRAATASDTVRR